MPTVTIGDNSTDDIAGCEDCELTEQDATTNSGSATDLFISNFSEPTTRNMLIRFTGIDSLPNTITVTAAKIVMFSSNVSGAAVQVTARRVLRNWVEGQATWNVYSTGNSWTTAGCLSDSNDRTATTSGVTGSLGGTGGYFDFFTNDAQLMDDIEAMAAGTFANHGWVLECTSATGTFEQWKSSEAGDETRPYLEITYTEGGGGATIVNRESLRRGIGRGILRGA